MSWLLPARGIDLNRPGRCSHFGHLPADCIAANRPPAATPPPLEMAAADIILAAMDAAAIPVPVKPMAVRTTGSSRIQQKLGNGEEPTTKHKDHTASQQAQETYQLLMQHLRVFLGRDGVDTEGLGQEAQFPAHASAEVYLPNMHIAAMQLYSDGEVGRSVGVTSSCLEGHLPADCIVATMLPAATPPPLEMAAADISLAAMDAAAIPVPVKPMAVRTTGSSRIQQKLGSGEEPTTKHKAHTASQQAQETYQLLMQHLRVFLGRDGVGTEGAAGLSVSSKVLLGSAGSALVANADRNAEETPPSVFNPESHQLTSGNDLSSWDVQDLLFW
ncbi:hypothetical protein U0070_024940 [Myodes glareolus]|uniref:Uncharacterized protein n=1 Tax=Myodes glareolus TaxID=447135 RepID=A0AAW0ITF4_MYOGA